MTKSNPPNTKTTNATTNRWAARRLFVRQSALGLGAIALDSLFDRLASGQIGGESAGVQPPMGRSSPNRSEGQAVHLPPKARRVIFLCQSGAPSQVDLFDPKPGLRDRHGDELPESVRGQQRLTTMTAQQSAKPIVASPWRFARHGQSGLELSELLPYTGRVADDLCVVRSLHTEAINHDPAITYLQTGSEQPGRPGWGAWVSYALGSENHNLPTFCVFISGGEPGDQPLNGRLWGPGFLPASHQGVKFRSQGDPVLYLANPPGIDAARRRRLLDRMNAIERLRAQSADGSDTVDSWIKQFELAAGMQTAVPELVDLATEPAHAIDLYGEDARRPGTFAANCLLARRMVERGVRFVQLYHRGWDHHYHLPSKLPAKCRQVDQPAAALVLDLKQRGLLEDTLVVWAGEFGRTVYCQGALTDGDFGRDHHPRCFSIWLAGGGVRPGTVVGRTDDFSYNVVDNAVHIHDLQATVLHLLGLDHERLTFRAQGRDFRLTDIAGRVVPEMLRA